MTIRTEGYDLMCMVMQRKLTREELYDMLATAGVPLNAQFTDVEFKMSYTETGEEYFLKMFYESKMGAKDGYVTMETIVKVPQHSYSFKEIEMKLYVGKEFKLSKNYRR